MNILNIYLTVWTMHRYKKLQVWQKSIDLAVEIYKITEKLPKQEQYGLFSQIDRAVISIASNIAEGAGRNTNKEFNNFWDILLDHHLSWTPS